eukprot:350149-Chlamydomonas_euryale.AAC.25
MLSAIPSCGELQLFRLPHVCAPLSILSTSFAHCNVRTAGAEPPPSMHVNCTSLRSLRARNGTGRGAMKHGKTKPCLLAAACSQLQACK